MNRNQNENRIMGVKIGQSRIKLSALVFGAVLAIGSGYAAIKHFTGEEAKLAKVLEEVPVGEIPGWWYSEYFGQSACEQESCADDADPDADKLTNYQEYYYGSNPIVRDTNNNGRSDGEDVAFGFAPGKEGDVTFEQAAADESIVGESLVFNEDAEGLIRNMSDLNKVVLPEVSDAELNISDKVGQEEFVNYMLALDLATKKYEKSRIKLGNLEQAVKVQNTAVTSELVAMSKSLAEDYRKIAVPRDMVTLHKYQIALWRNLEAVVNAPSADSNTGMMYDVDMNKWYDSVQVMMSLNQKIAVEMHKLRSKYTF